MDIYAAVFLKSSDAIFFVSPVSHCIDDVHPSDYSPILI
jgi:hypothetical protein